MFMSWPSSRSPLKGYLIEAVSIAISFLVDFLLTEPEHEFDSVRLSIDLRIYYLSKNLLHFVDTLLLKKKDNRHLYGAAFNLAVGAALHPASRLPQTTNSTVNLLSTESLVYSSGITARALLEMPLERQWINQYLLTHKWKLLSGSVGVLSSMIPFFALSSPAFYWTGELVDSWRSKNKEESFPAHLLSAKANVPLQVFIGKLIKICVKASGKNIPFPDFLIDAMAGIIHRIAIDLANLHAAKSTPPLPITNPITRCNATLFQTPQTQLNHAIANDSTLPKPFIVPVQML